MRRILPIVVFALAASNPLAAQREGTFDHSGFDALLGANVSADGLVDYRGFAGSPDFQRYLASLAAAEPETLSGPEQLAFWINAYNAYTIDLINRHQEHESIRNINKTLGFFSGKGPWKERFAEVAGEVWTLDEIEHEVIRKRFSEPRIHFALVCAALGCPPLLPAAYTGPNLEEELDDRVRVFLLESPTKNRVEPEEGLVYLSPIFDWYRDDFPSGTAGFGSYLAQYYPPGPERTLLESGQFRIETHGLRLEPERPGLGPTGGRELSCSGANSLLNIQRVTISLWDVEEKMTNNEAFQIAEPFTEFLEGARKNRDLWHAMVARTKDPQDLVERISSASGSWRLLVIADDWCGDAVNTLPTIAVLAEASPNLELRVVSRESVPELMDRHLTRGARAIPVVILLDDEGRERGWWGPRPRQLQEWFNRVGRGMEKGDRYRELRRWYARDRGVATAEAIADLIVCGSEKQGTSPTRDDPCDRLRAA